MSKVVNFLRDPVLQGAAFLIAVVALIWGVYTNWWQVPIDDLQVTILTNTSLVKITEGFSDQVKITYAGHEAGNLSLIEVKLENTGNKAIPAASYERPIKFIFPSETEIVKAISLESVPENLELQITPLKNQAIISPTLLNPQDRATIRFLVINMPVDLKDLPFKIDARIQNVKKVNIIGTLGQPQNREVNLSDGIIIMILILVCGVFYGYYSYERRKIKESNRWARIVIACPKTGETVPTGITSNEYGFVNLSMENNSFICSACGQQHIWLKENAWREEEKK